MSLLVLIKIMCRWRHSPASGNLSSRKTLQENCIYFYCFWNSFSNKNLTNKGEFKAKILEMCQLFY